jgi:N-acetylmuramoyl-L-alanine amidase
MLVYINAGHNVGKTGGYDPGAIGPTGLREADVTLDVAARLGNLLRTHGLRTLGGSKESFIQARTSANRANVDLLVSLHCNAAASSSARGFEMLYYRQDSYSPCAFVLDNVRKQIVLGCGEKRWATSTYDLRMRGIIQRSNLSILKSRVPSVLAELAFISNPTEEGWLRDRFFLQQMAQALADGIAFYARKVGKS